MTKDVLELLREYKNQNGGFMMLLEPHERELLEQIKLNPKVPFEKRDLAFHLAQTGLIRLSCSGETANITGLAEEWLRRDRLDQAGPFKIFVYRILAPLFGGDVLR